MKPENAEAAVGFAGSCTVIVGAILQESPPTSRNLLFVFSCSSSHLLVVGKPGSCLYTTHNRRWKSAYSATQIALLTFTSISRFQFVPFHFKAQSVESLS